MKTSRFALGLLAFGLVCATSTFVACGTDGGSVFGEKDSGAADASGEGSTDPFGHGDSGLTDGGKPCVNLCKQQVACDGGKVTSISGKVYDPAGKVPLYNAVVYVPNAKVDPITTGASCDKCGAVSGDPLVTAITDATGSFKLLDVPVGKSIPLVIQVGKWRRQITIPEVKACEDLPVTDPQTIRLPKNQSEGDMPQMAIATGASDPFECLLLKMGIDPVEFTPDTKTKSGRVHYYQSNGVTMDPNAGVVDGGKTPDADSLWNNLALMKAHDIIMLPCEGEPLAKPDVGAISPKGNLQAYANAGGRVFTTHYGYVWLAGAGVDANDAGDPTGPFKSTGTWKGEFPIIEANLNPPFDTKIDQTFPKGDAYAHWLMNVGASSTLGTLTVIESRHDLVKENNPPAQRWNYGADFHGEGPGVMHITFNTPLGVTDDKVCGRVVFSDFHVSAAALSGQPYFPDSCIPGDLTPQEKALEFMFFDLSSCIQSDKTPPTPPGIH